LLGIIKLRLFWKHRYRQYILKEDKTLKSGIGNDSVNYPFIVPFDP
jgi:hypothetical protein